MCQDKIYWVLYCVSGDSKKEIIYTFKFMILRTHKIMYVLISNNINNSVIEPRKKSTCAPDNINGHLHS